MRLLRVAFAVIFLFLLFARPVSGVRGLTACLDSAVTGAPGERS